ncbi:MAG TPA: glycoside hydrolase family 88 protein [Thermoguttaceae bacterium]|nr:glycoside hydrolase family 88 protein [Thermoguttaceae bacterium]
MKPGVKTIAAVTACVLAATLALEADGEPAATRENTLAIMRKVADWQLAHPANRRLDDWTHGALYAGMMALGDLSPDPKYRDAMMSVGKANQWNPGFMVYHADDHCVGQMYCEMYTHYRNPAMLAPLRARLDYVLTNPSKGKVEERFPVKEIPAGILRWWWCDALFMAPPAWTRLYAVTGDEKYLDFMLREWWATSDLLYDKDEHLYFRDNSFFARKESNGKKIFWSRGNGWVMGGLVRVLQYLPADHPQRARFVEQFRQMADKLLACQQADGSWHASLLDPKIYPGPETSGSGFNGYALAWGVNEGLLDRAKFEPAVRKAWASLVGCVAKDGKLTHVQPVGGSPRRFDPRHTDNYGVGAFLLAGSEMVRMQLLADVANTTIHVTNDADRFRPQETVEVSMAELKAKLPGVTAENVAVMDGAAALWITSQTVDADGDGQAETLLFQADFLPKQKKEFTIFAGVDRTKLPAPTLKVAARFVPERLDDFAWENDRIALRLYGPALWKQDGPSKTGSGVDVWCKHVRGPVVDGMYKKGVYHEDDGRGVDCYKVGNARGCGGTAVWAQDALWASRCFDSWKLVSAGPIRATFELTYGPWDAAGRNVSEVKRISLDLGSNLNRIESRFKVEDADPLTVAAGLTIHAGGHVDHGDDWATVWEPTDGKNNGMLGLGLVVPGGTFKQAKDHAIVVAEVAPERPFVHYAGAGWSKGLDFPDRAAWKRYVEDFAARLASPLKVEIP